jgi:hypothetical protein
MKWNCIPSSKHARCHVPSAQNDITDYNKTVIKLEKNFIMLSVEL